MWKVGDRITHRFNPELGPGRVSEICGRFVEVEFPESGQVLRIATASDALLPLVLKAGQQVRHGESGERLSIEEVLPDGRCVLADGRTVNPELLWPVHAGASPFERLAQGDIGRLGDYENRLSGLQLAALREADGLGSFLGGRIRIFPHQIYVAERATGTDPVRWLLADEVGLGKTVEACLILNRLIRSGRVQRVLVVAPETLTVQWLGELWRKYHQVFVLLDDKRIADVAKDYGEDFNPFDAYSLVVTSLELLVEQPRLAEQAVQAGIDLTIVDEAHHLRRAPGHPGNAAYRAVAPLAAQGRHMLLLTATPLEDDAQGFLRLVQLLRPEFFPEGEDLTAQLARGVPLPACTSVTRRVDIGGFPPRMPRAVDLPVESLTAFRDLEAALRQIGVSNPVQRDAKREKIARAFSSGAALISALSEQEGTLRRLAKRSDREDPRLRWLAEQAPVWRERGEKTLVFVARRESLELLRREMSERAQVKTGVFHEDLSAARRDIEVAQFRLPEGPSMLISTECGGEGRNFEFCHRLVLFDLPWSPTTVEQRIGRLDRIGRSIPVEVIYFRRPEGIGAAVAGLYEAIGLMKQPLGGLQRELRHIEDAVSEIALGQEGVIAPSILDEVVAEAREAHARVQDAAYQELHREPYLRDMAEGILARIPEGLEALIEEVVLGSADCLSLWKTSQPSRNTWSFELGRDATVESMPGIPEGFSFIGTFDREAAVANEMIDFFASGHPFVESILMELEDSPRGRTALLHVEAGDEVGFGLLAVYRGREGLEALAVDMQGRSRPDLAELLTHRPLKTRRIDAAAWTERPEWARTVQALAAHLERDVVPEAAAAFMIGPYRRGAR